MFNWLWSHFFQKKVQGHFTTVHYAFPVVVIAAIFASLAAVISENATYVTLKTDVSTVARDQEFFIDVSVNAHVPINAIDLVLSYSEDKINVKSIDTGTSVITLWTEEPRVENGAVYLRGGTFRKGFLGEHTVARIRAKAVEAGEARFFLEDSQFVAGDGKGTEVKGTETSKNELKIVVSGADGVIAGKASIAIVTDTDGDGDVDLGDISAFMAAWFTKEKTYDFNGDGRMTFRDFSILLADSFLK